MTAQRLSPTAKLLRGSRLFSLPPPLPKPSHDPAATSTHASDTATLPYPTRAAIETTQSSLSRGDWGLKRPLPQQSTAVTSTPTIRVSAIDSIDHITDFDSAADHMLTLRKWHEMDIPISMPYAPYVASTPLAPTPSVFEPGLDNTESSAQGSGRSPRWKFEGPWLAGKTEGDFQTFVDKDVKRRRPEFRHFLKQALREKKATNVRRAATAGGEEQQSYLPDISEQEFERAIKELRQEQSRRELEGYITRFFDLPGVDGRSLPQRDAGPQRPLSIYDKAMRSNGSMESGQGPPKTHRSAGLSYLRTSSHVPNHPLIGPMSTQQPVQSRILLAASQGMQQSKVTVGVGGVTAVEIPKGGQGYLQDRSKPKGWASFDPDIEGGPKVWVHPKQASIDSHGRIRLHIDIADKNTLDVWMGESDEEPLSDIVQGTDKSVPDLRDFQNRQQQKVSSSSRNSDAAKFRFQDRQVSNEVVQEGLFRMLKLHGKST
ncbi:hypothetical protein MMC06_005873 [Schaereria dolodes]|nr:hypothetical protein [Schaereria dolodes]